MTDEQINCAIAKACGISGNTYKLCLKTGNYEQSPNFCNDLNAIHEAEKILITDSNFETYYLSLYDTTYSTIWPVCATARQRAEALLRTLDKWEEGK